MSLLHQALKKAELEKKGPAPGGPFVDASVQGEKPPIRLYVLISLVAISGVAALFLTLRNPLREKPLATVPPDSSQERGSAEAPDTALALEAEKYFKEGNWEKASEVLEKQVVSEPQNAEAYNNLGLVLKKLGKKRMAIEQYKKALTLRPDFPEALNNLGVLYLSEGRLEEALDSFQNASQIKPDYAEPYFHAALIYEAQGQTAKASGNFKSFLKWAGDLDSSFSKEIKERIASLESSE